MAFDFAIVGGQKPQRGAGPWRPSASSACLAVGRRWPKAALWRQDSMFSPQPRRFGQTSVRSPLPKASRRISSHVICKMSLRIYRSSTCAASLPTSPPAPTPPLPRPSLDPSPPDPHGAIVRLRHAVSHVGITRDLAFPPLIHLPRSASASLKTGSRLRISRAS